MTALKTTPTADGTLTLYDEATGDHYHSTQGARQESTHVFIRNGFDHLAEAEPVILEVGFGTGLNAFLTALRAEEAGKKVHYEAIDRFYPDWETVQTLHYARNEAEKQLLEKLVKAPLHKRVTLGQSCALYKMQTDFLCWKPERKYHLVYFDAFGPDKQPGMWQQQGFEKLYAHLLPEGSLVTYSAKGSIRRMLEAIGFQVERLPGPPGKRHIVRATKYTE